jgi:hypothetical protein
MVLYFASRGLSPRVISLLLKRQGFCRSKQAVACKLKRLRTTPHTFITDSESWEVKTIDEWITLQMG